MPQVTECFDPDHSPVQCGIDQVEEINDELLRLTNNTRYLRALFEITRQGQALFICQAPVADVSLGMPVYYHVGSGTFRPAQVQFTEQNSELVLADSSHVMGIVTAYVPGSATATVLLEGLASVDLTESTGFASPSGLYYLTRESGQLSLSEDRAVSAPCLFALGNGTVLFHPRWSTPLSQYRIRKYTLTANPSGTPVTTSGRVSIVGGGDATVRGWLASDHASFSGKEVPVDAVFGYNLAAHLDVSEIWPPSPLELVQLLWQVNGDGRGGAGVVSSELVHFNSDGIWWLSDCADQVPWSETGPASACSERIASALTLLFPDLVANDTGRVTSLRSLSDSLKFYREGTTTEATSGALVAALQASWALGSTTDDPGILAVKAVDAQGLLSRGPVVSGLKSGSDELVLTGGVLEASTGFRYGGVTVDLAGPQKAELLPQRIALDGAATDESHLVHLAVGMPPNVNSAIRTQFYIPGVSADAFYLLQYEVWLQAASDGVLPALTSQARAWKRPTIAVGSQPTEDTVLSLSVPATPLLEGQYIEVVSEAFALQQGSMISLLLSRNVSSGDRSSIETRVLKQVLRIIRLAELEEVEDLNPSGIYNTSYANQYG